MGDLWERGRDEAGSVSEEGEEGRRMGRWETVHQSEGLEEWESCLENLFLLLKKLALSETLVCYVDKVGGEGDAALLYLCS